LIWDACSCQACCRSYAMQERGVYFVNALIAIVVGRDKNRI
jgi:hypothetical protein